MRKMRTAIIAVALAAVMVMPVAAKPSPKADTVAPAAAVTVAAQNTTVETLEADVKAEVSKVVANTQVLTDLGVNTSAKLASSFDLEYKGEIPEGGVVIPIKVNKAKAGDYAYVLHRKDSVAGAPWEKVGEGVLGADLTVNATFTSFSPVAVMVVDAAEVADTTVKAPKTGEF